MNYDTIENLVIRAKLGDSKAKELLANEFTPLILKLSKKSFINSYEFEDIRNECYKTLFKCITLYNPDKHRFVAYATNAIKNSVNYLIRVSVRRSGAEGPGAFVLDDKPGSLLFSNSEQIDDIIINQDYKSKLKLVIKNLDPNEVELLTYVYFNGQSLKEYSEIKGMSYSIAVSKKSSIIKKIRKALEANSKKAFLS